MFSCSYCKATNCFIEWNNWLQCRECALLTEFEWDAPDLPFPEVNSIKAAIFEMVKDAAPLGTSDEGVAAIINSRKHWEEGDDLEPFPDWRIYANYYNLYIKLKHEKANP
jgi:hypothetical protein